MTNNTHDCIHEDHFIGQSRAIERISSELNYKKERLDELKDYTKELKEDNDRIEGKIDDIKDCVNQMILTSKRDDDKLKDIINNLTNRLTAVETTNKTLKWVVGVGLSGAGVCIAGLALLLTHII